jgi:hypothetical protein
MMMNTDNLFSRLGFRVTKPSVKITVPDDVAIEHAKLSAQRRAKYEHDAIETAEMYFDVLPLPFIIKMMEHNDYLCLQWGGRKVARLVNLCRNTLDIEILTDGRELNEIDRAPVLRLLVLMCWLFPIPLKQHLKMVDVESHYRPLIKDWLISYKLVQESEVELVLSGVFEGVMVRKNAVLDIFHDALRYEESQFGYKLNPGLMRTVLGENDVFRVHAQKNSQSNLAPHWLSHLQDLYGVEGLIDKALAKSDEEYAEQDGITS